MAKELTLTQTKAGHDPLELLDTGDPLDEAKFIEYATATHRRQCHRWSNGLRQHLRTPAEQTDEEIAKDNDRTGELWLSVKATTWNRLTEHQRLSILELAEASADVALASTTGTYRTWLAFDPSG